MNSWKQASRQVCGDRPCPKKQFIRKETHRANRRAAKIALRKGSEIIPVFRLDSWELS